MARVVAAVAYIVVFCFASYTLVTHALVFCGSNLNVLVRVAAAVLSAIGIATIFFSLQREERARQPAIPPELPWEDPRWHWICTAAGLVALYWWWGRYAVFWAAALGYLVLALRVCGPKGETVRTSAPLPRRYAGILVVCCLVAFFITLIANRPDHDDAFFASIAAHALANPSSPLLSTDTMGIASGAPLPLLLTAYKVHTIELLSAVLVQWFGGVPLTYSHLVLPAFFAIAMVVAWALCLYELTASHWLAGVVVVVILAVGLGESHRGFGNFAFVRLHQGKAVMASVAVPLAYAFTWRYLRSGRKLDVLALAATAIMAIGLSSSALFVMPLVIGGALVSGYEAGNRWRCVIAGVLSLGYPFGLALGLRAGTMGATDLWTYDYEGAWQITQTVFGRTSQYLIWFALLSAWAFAPDRAMARKLLLLSVFAFCVAANPFFAHALSRYVTSPPTYWRVLWSIPVYAFCAVVVLGTSAAVARMRHKVWKLPLAISASGLLAFWLVPQHTLRHANAVTLQWPPAPKVAQPEYEIGQRVISLTERGRTILAPEALAVWLTAGVVHPRLVLVREQYVHLLRAHVDEQDVQDRITVARLINSNSTPSDGDLLALLRTITRHDVGTIALKTPVAESLLPVVKQAHFHEVFRDNGFVIFKRAYTKAAATMERGSQAREKDGTNEASASLAQVGGVS